jgi:hypothetical protein
MQVATENTVPASANVYWIGKRNDNAVPNSTIDTPINGGATRAANVATFQTLAAHGLVVGQSVSVSGVSVPSFNGTFQVLSTPTANTFTVDNPKTMVSHFKLLAKFLKNAGIKQGFTYSDQPIFKQLVERSGMPVKITQTTQQIGNEMKPVYMYTMDL